MQVLGLILGPVRPNLWGSMKDLRRSWGLYLSPVTANTACVFSIREYPTSSKATGKNNKSLYTDLGLTSRASSKEIRQAYLELSKKHHPDLNPDDPEAMTKFQKVNEAHDVLSNPRLRRQYDLGKMGQKTSVADREITKHRFEGDEFMDSRAAYREEYKSSNQTTKNLDYWMKQNTSTSFRTKQHMMNRKGSDTYQGHIRSDEWKQVRRDAVGGGSGAIIPVFVILVGIAMIWTADKPDSRKKK